MPDDHSEAYWLAWDFMHPTPIGMGPKGSHAKPRSSSTDAPRTWSEATEYHSPYEACTAAARDFNSAPRSPKVIARSAGPPR